MHIASITNIGKESNRLEDVEAGLVHDADDVYTTYPDPRRDDWHKRIVPALRHVSLRRFERETGKSRRLLIDARSGRRKPHARHRAMFTALCRKLRLL